MRVNASPWPRCAASYTVGPQVYQVMCLPSGSRGTNTSFCLVRVLYSLSGCALSPGRPSPGALHWPFRPWCPSSTTIC